MDGIPFPNYILEPHRSGFKYGCGGSTAPYAGAPDDYSEVTLEMVQDVSKILCDLDRGEWDLPE